ncbi:MAG: hypothetical protein NT062_35435 [Proteobacteria bacterium]|nr:hypothetical protein [Pseudomonadota bacterium]
MKKTLPVFLGMLVGIYAVVEYFIPHHAVRGISTHVFEWGSIVAASAYVIGGVNLVQVTWPKIRRREQDWPYKVVLLGSAVVMLLIALPLRACSDAVPGTATITRQDAAAAARHVAIVELEAPADVLIKVAGTSTTATATPRVEVAPGKVEIKSGRRVVGYEAFATTVDVAAGDVVHVSTDPAMVWGTDGRARTWVFDHVFGPCNATMFALLAFFVASAAFRAFRARNFEAGLLLGSAIIVLLARAPMGRAIAGWLPDLAQWILDIPSNGSRRAIMMGAAVGAIATGLRVILGIERSHLGGEE